MCLSLLGASKFFSFAGCELYMPVYFFLQIVSCVRVNFSFAVCDCTVHAGIFFSLGANCELCAPRCVRVNFSFAVCELYMPVYFFSNCELCTPRCVRVNFSFAVCELYMPVYFFKL